MARFGLYLVAATVAALALAPASGRAELLQAQWGSDPDDYPVRKPKKPKFKRVCVERGHLERGRWSKTCRSIERACGRYKWTGDFAGYRRCLREIPRNCCYRSRLEKVPNPWD